MKIEKLTENKIRIIVNEDDFKNNNIDFHKFILKSVESQSLFLKILNRAKEEFNFDVDGYKLLVETFASSDDIFIFTITKYKDEIFNDKPIDNNKIDNTKRVLKVKKQTDTLTLRNRILKFTSFEDFCSFCEMIFYTKINIKDFCKNNSLYLLKNTYYLLLENIKLSDVELKIFNNYISEFSLTQTFSNNFQFKLKEHGKLIIKKNAILNTITLFVK